MKLLPLQKRYCLDKSPPQVDQGFHLPYNLIQSYPAVFANAEVDTMTLAHNFSTQISNLTKLKQLAAQFGFIQTRGAQKGEGSVRQLLEALIAGEAIILRTQSSNPSLTAERQDMELQQKLLAQGLLREIKPLANRRLAPFNPIQVEGEPISQMILRERR
jgi:hypothetical protein